MCLDNHGWGRTNSRTTCWFSKERKQRAVPVSEPAGPLRSHMKTTFNDWIRYFLSLLFFISHLGKKLIISPLFCFFTLHRVHSSLYRSPLVVCSFLSASNPCCYGWGTRRAGRFLSWEVVLCVRPLPPSYASLTPLLLEGDLIWWPIWELTNSKKTLTCLK